MPTHDSSARRVVIAGGGVAALEAALALRSHLGADVDLELIAPDRQFLHRPMTVAEPFGAEEAQAFDLAAIAEDIGVTLREDAVESVDVPRRCVGTARGAEIRFAALLVAVGARPTPWLEGALTFRGRNDIPALRELLAGLEGGDADRVAFALPPGTSWSLPLYELALLTAGFVAEHGLAGIRLMVVTPEESPLGLFGPAADGIVRGLLSDRGIELMTSSYAARFNEPRLAIRPDCVRFVDCVVALAHLEPRTPRGLPAGPDGFIPTDEHGRVTGAPGVYAAGDGTSFPVKQGGIAAQQADAAAASIASSLGADVDPMPFQPVLRGTLLTGLSPAYLRADLSGAAGDNTQVAAEPLWWPAAKVASRHLAPYLAKRELSAG